MADSHKQDEDFGGDRVANSMRSPPLVMQAQAVVTNPPEPPEPTQSKPEGG